MSHTKLNATAARLGVDAPALQAARVTPHPVKAHTWPPAAHSNPTCYPTGKRCHHSLPLPWEPSSHCSPACRSQQLQTHLCGAGRGGTGWCCLKAGVGSTALLRFACKQSAACVSSCGLKVCCGHSTTAHHAQHSAARAAHLKAAICARHENQASGKPCTSSMRGLPLPLLVRTACSLRGK